MPSPRRIIDDIALCLVFFTRLPLPVLDFQGRKLANAIWAAPFVGLVVALIGACIYAIAAKFGLSTAPAAALALAATVLVTGCLHEDGLSDVADGFGGGNTQAKKLEIMRDSRIGAYGACALLLSMLLRWSALAELSGPVHVLLALIAAHAASRSLLAGFMHILPPARTDGLSSGAGAVAAKIAAISLAIGFVALLCLGLSGAFAAVLLVGATFFAFRALCLRQIGGQTGDTLGALQQLCEIAILLVASVVLT